MQIYTVRSEAGIKFEDVKETKPAESEGGIYRREPPPKFPLPPSSHILFRGGRREKKSVGNAVCGVKILVIFTFGALGSRA